LELDPNRAQRVLLAKSVGAEAGSDRPPQPRRYPQIDEAIRRGIGMSRGINRPNAKPHPRAD